MPLSALIRKLLVGWGSQCHRLFKFGHPYWLACLCLSFFLLLFENIPFILYSSPFVYCIIVHNFFYFTSSFKINLHSLSQVGSGHLVLLAVGPNAPFKSLTRCDNRQREVIAEWRCLAGSHHHHHHDGQRRLGACCCCRCFFFFYFYYIYCLNSGLLVSTYCRQDVFVRRHRVCPPCCLV